MATTARWFLQWSWLLFGGLAQLASCAGRLASLPVEQLYAARRLPAVEGEVRDAARTGDDAFVVISGGGDPRDERLVSSAGDTQPAVAMPAVHGFCAGERLVADDDGAWWYSRCESLPSPRVVFAGRTERAVPIPPLTWAWLPLAGSTPSGLLLSATAADTAAAVRVQLMDAGGTRELAVLDTNAQRTWFDWAAARIDEERIALLAIDNADRGVVRLWLLKEGSPPVQAEWSFAGGPRLLEIATAVCDDRALGVVVQLEHGGGVGALVVDPDHPEDATPRILDAGSAGDVRIAATSQRRFVAAWSRAGGDVQLCELSRTGTYPPVTVGEGSVQLPLLQLRRVRDRIDVVWRSPDGVVVRSLPEHPTGHLLGVALLQALRRRFH
jgi:hypothetical protein